MKIILFHERYFHVFKYSHLNSLIANFQNSAKFENIMIFIYQIGMVAWKMTLLTPEFPEGRDVIIISNDITSMIGSFGVREDLLFFVSNYLADCLIFIRTIYIFWTSYHCKYGNVLVFKKTETF